MPSILSHLAVPLAVGLALGSKAVSGRLLAASLLTSMLPDLDVLAFRLGIGYANDFGHRGASHSLACAYFLGLLALPLAVPLRSSRGARVLVRVYSRGIARLARHADEWRSWRALALPVSHERFFIPARPIEASPLHLRRFFSAAGATVLLSELRWVWLPAVLAGTAVFLARRTFTRSALNGKQSHGGAYTSPGQVMQIRS